MTTKKTKKTGDAVEVYESMATDKRTGQPMLIKKTTRKMADGSTETTLGVAKPPRPKALTTDQRATVKLWAERILADDKRPPGARQYPSPDERIAAGLDLMGMPTAAGKPLGECTGLEGRMLSKAYAIVAEQQEAVAKAAQTLAF